MQVQGYDHRSGVAAATFVRTGLRTSSLCPWKMISPYENNPLISLLLRRCFLKGYNARMMAMRE